MKVRSKIYIKAEMMVTKLCLQAFNTSGVTGCKIKKDWRRFTIEEQSNNKVFTGLAEIHSQSVFFNYEKGKLKLMLPNNFNLSIINNDITHVVGILPETKHNIIFFLNTPLSLDHYGDAIAFFGIVINCEVSFFIENAKVEQGFIPPITRMIFKFDELDNFLPSSNLMDYDSSTQKTTFERYNEVSTFDMTISGHNTKLIFSHNLNWQKSNVSTAATHTHMTFEFAETTDAHFMMDVYYLVYELFCFIYNRRNLSLNSAFLMPKIYNGDLSKNPTLHIIDRYRHKRDGKERIKHPCLYRLYSKSIKALFQIFIDGKQISDSIHPSSNYARLIDKRHYLPISSAFEYLFRSSSGFNTRLNSGNFDSCEFAVKIRKVYDDSDGYTGLNHILSGWFGNDIKGLAQVANDWRNEYAHENRNGIPSLDVIKSARLLEHINYAMIFRYAGFSDDCIKSILSETLYRW